MNSQGMNYPGMNCPGINYLDTNNQKWICGNELSGNEPFFNPSKKPQGTNTKVTKENEDRFWRYQSRFLEAPLIRQTDGELKNTLDMKLPTVFDMENCSERTAARR